ncbi:hypothetical protein C4J98_1960 [Pseudomonas orientalis]|nr:hypothetical protein C4J98_1960 [Pseudomonas orientalis]
MIVGAMVMSAPIFPKNADKKRDLKMNQTWQGG